MSWRDNAVPDRDGFGLGQLNDGETVVVGFIDDGREVETEHGTAVQWGVQVMDVPDGLTDMSGANVETYDGSDGQEYNLMSSSNRLAYQLANYADTLEGETVAIEAVGDPDSFDRTYVVSDA